MSMELLCSIRLPRHASWFYEISQRLLFAGTSGPKHSRGLFNMALLAFEDAGLLRAVLILLQQRVI